MNCGSRFIDETTQTESSAQQRSKEAVKHIIDCIGSIFMRKALY